MHNAEEIAEGIISNVDKVIVGKRAEIELAVIALMCQGHLLIEDVPGVGKTVLAKAIAKSIGCNFKRIQFTPDLLPSDVTGVSIFNQKSGEFEYRPGPIMAQVVLADEINRATPKTQSALLEAMEERQVTVDGVTYYLPEPFIVMATENPIEYEGTFPLPEAQLDRFMMRLSIGYPDAFFEAQILGDQKRVHPLSELSAVISPTELETLQSAVKDIYVDNSIREYIVAIATWTRQHKDVYLGASPRGSLALFRASQALALRKSRDYVIPDDVKAMAKHVLAHRLLVNPAARLKNTDPADIVAEIIDSVPVPSGRLGAR